MARSVLMGLALLVSAAFSTRAGEQEWVLGMPQLHRLDLLPQLSRSVEVGSISSYDRTGGNDDGFSGKYSFVAREPEGLVIAELPGPGILYRIWTPTPSDDLVEFRFDGEAKPRIAVKFRDIFSGTSLPFVVPLVGHGAGGFYSYVPLAYRKSCKITIRAERVQFYQINLLLLPDAVRSIGGTGVGLPESAGRRAGCAGRNRHLRRAAECE